MKAKVTSLNHKYGSYTVITENNIVFQFSIQNNKTLSLNELIEIDLEDDVETKTIFILDTRETLAIEI